MRNFAKEKKPTTTSFGSTTHRDWSEIAAMTESKKASGFSSPQSSHSGRVIACSRSMAMRDRLFAGSSWFQRSLNRSRAVPRSRFTGTRRSGACPDHDIARLHSPSRLVGNRGGDGIEVDLQIQIFVVLPLGQGNGMLAPEHGNEGQIGRRVFL